MINKKRYQNISNISGDQEEDTIELRELAVEAMTYIQSFAWCPLIKDAYLAYGVGRIIGVFLIDFESKIHETDDELWVVAGDLPSAYLVVEPEDDEVQALERYCEMMEQWVIAVRAGEDMSQVFPVRIQPTLAHAEMLSMRIEILRSEIIPQMKQ
ncbi:hypothetical protein [Dyella sp.]|uniref:hypothetical protein n=1 Tax=Dyella sp. TaxID=1869338 RepID=UPI003F81066F